MGSKFVRRFFYQKILHIVRNIFQQIHKISINFWSWPRNTYISKTLCWMWAKNKFRIAYRKLYPLHLAVERISHTVLNRTASSEMIAPAVRAPSVRRVSKSPAIYAVLKRCDVSERSEPSDLRESRWNEIVN